MKRVLLTGSTGMVGRNILECGLGSNYSIIAPGKNELNLLNFQDTLNYLSKQKPDLIIHAAGLVGGISANINQPTRFLLDNTLIGINLVHSAHLAGVNDFINLGSSCMYPKGFNDPISEDKLLSGYLEPTNEGYALAKISTHKLCQYINNEFGRRYITLVPCNLYGKFDKFDPRHAHMIPAVLRRMHENKVLQKNEIIVWGDGAARREFMYVEDLVSAIRFLINLDYKDNDLINIGLNSDFTILEYYKKISEVVDIDCKFIFDKTKPIGMHRKLIDSSKIFNLGWRPSVSLEEGLSKTYKYFLESNI